MYPNILFFVVDSFRADRFFGNNKTSYTPNLDLLLKKGTYFEQTISSADGTFLTLSSLFNGLFPFVTNVRSNEVVLREDNFLEIIKNNGYHIYGKIPDSILLSALKNYLENKNSTFQVKPPLKKERFTDKLCLKILDFMDSQNIVEPWFYYLHMYDLHFPRIVPNDFVDPKFGNDDYDKILSAIDFWFGKLIEKIDLTNTILVITADHGTHVPFDGKNTAHFEPEFKGTLNISKKIMPKSSHKIGAKMIVNLRNQIRNSRLKKVNEGLTPYQIRSRLPHTTLSIYDESIKIPLLFIGKNIPQNKIIPNQISTVDIFPTIMELIHSKTLHTQIHGRSLIPLMQEKPFDEQPIFLHTIPHEEIDENDKVGLRTSKFKYFRHSQDSTKEIHLFDLKNDPLENNNIAQNNPSVIKEMEEVLEELTKNVTIENMDDMDDKRLKRIQEELRLLGYRKT
tara:strand:- start:70 stop:1425 length:1356 start_codon:yes stop_codon:yes gene_type:complete